MSSNLKSIGLPNLDSICNADFVKKLKFKTKKELICFLQDDENADDLDFLKGLDNQVLEKHNSISQEIKDYFLTIVDKLTIYREEIKKKEKMKRQEAKERKAQENKELKELEKQKIIEEYLAKEALKKEKEAIIKRNGIIPNLKEISQDCCNLPQNKKEESADEIADKITPRMTNKPKLKLGQKPKLSSTKEIQLDLQDYFRIAQQLIKEEIFKVYTDTGDAVEVQCLMMEGEKIKMILKSDD